MTVTKEQFCDLSTCMSNRGMVSQEQYEEAMGSAPPKTKTRSSTWDDQYDFTEGNEDWLIMHKTIPVAVNSTEQVATGATVHIEVSLQKAAADGLCEVFMELGRPSDEKPRFLVRAVDGTIPVTHIIWAYDVVNS